MSRKPFDDDDGRTLADMSGLSVRTPLGFHAADKLHGERKRGGNGTGSRPWEDAGLSKDARRGAMWGALSAALLIALAFIVGLGLVIAAICWIFA